MACQLNQFEGLEPGMKSGGQLNYLFVAITRPVIGSAQWLASHSTACGDVN